MSAMCRCGHPVTTPFCGQCGRKWEQPACEVSLLIYLRGQRSKTQAWVTRTERQMACLGEEERERRLSRHRATLERWDAWIALIETVIDEKQAASRKPAKGV